MASFGTATTGVFNALLEREYDTAGVLQATQPPATMARQLPVTLRRESLLKRQGRGAVLIGRGRPFRPEPPAIGRR